MKINYKYIHTYAYKNIHTQTDIKKTAASTSA